MRKSKGRGFAAVVVATGVVLFGLSGFTWAKSVRTRVHASLKASVKAPTKPQPLPEALAVPGVMPDEVVATEAEVETAPAAETVSAEATPTAVATSSVDEKSYRLRMDNMHTGEKIDIVYRIGNTYIPEALDRLNAFLRDHNTQDVIDYAPKEFDVLHAMMTRLGKLDSVIDVVCGYRTPETNAALRHNSPRSGVAQHSQHMEGHAIDLRVPGVSTTTLRNAALSLHAGGVGYYPVSQFVHVDVGPVRQWSFAPHAATRTRRARPAVTTGM